MTKRRHPSTESVNNLNKRRYLTHRVVTVQEAIHVLIKYFDTIKRDSSHGDDEIIMQSTSVLEILAEASCAVLAARAKASGNKGKLHDALSDALKAIEYHSTSAQGYLAAGQLYLMQGKNQEAINTFERGLCMALPTECPQLYDQREKAKLLSPQKIDFVEKLPTEITTAIFNRLNDIIIDNYYVRSGKKDSSLTLPNSDSNNDNKLVSLSHITCTQVSKRWREFVLRQCPALWKTAKIGHWPLVPLHEKFIPSSSRYVQHLILSDEATEQSFERLVDMAGKDMFPRIQEVVLQFDSWSESTKERLMLLLITLLRRSLTRICIEPSNTLVNEDMREEQNTFPLGMLMSLCNNLKQLYLGTGLVFRYNPVQWSTSYNLTRLAVNISHGMNGLERLITQCPHLQYLSISEHSSQILALLDEYCPYLRYLHMGYSPCLGTTKEKQDEEKNLTPITSFGLYELIYEVPSLGVLQTLVPLLIKSRETLEKLILHITVSQQTNNDNNNNISGTDQQFYPSFGNVGFNRLKELQLTGAGDTTGQLAVAAASMIQKCSTLENVGLCFPGSPVPDRFFTSLIKQPFIRVLHFKDIDFPTTGAVQLFTELAVRSEKISSSVLKTVDIEKCRGLTNEVLCALTDILTLQYIGLGFNSSSVSVNDLSTIIRKLRTLPCLKIISFSHIQHINDTMIIQLTEFDGLTNLILEGLPDITDDGILTIAQQKNSLKHICIIHCQKISQQTKAFISSKFSYN
ncbi:hypothetical protein BDC45DRAFT_270192 [Circinella umbellata]|nr:hypothetical protein BDC45DRAFT_270192 [Circinella umbellata]